MAIIGNYVVPAEVIVNIFERLPPEQNTANARVSKNWKPFAEDVAKKQIILPTQQEILRKAANFLRMVPHRLEHYCQSFQLLTQMRQNRENFTFNQIHGATLQATEKQRVCMAFFYRIAPADPHIPADRQAELADRVFVELHFEQDDKPRLWRAQGSAVTHLPIELFNLTVNDPNFVIAGVKNEGTTCFAFHGRLIEFRLEQGSERVRTAIWTGIQGANRDAATTWPLTAADADSGWIWAEDLYVARIHAPILP